MWTGSVAGWTRERLLRRITPTFSVVEWPDKVLLIQRDRGVPTRDYAFHFNEEGRCWRAEQYDDGQLVSRSTWNVIPDPGPDGFWAWVRMRVRVAPLRRLALGGRRWLW